MIPSMLHGFNVSCNHFRIALVGAPSKAIYLYEHVKLNILSLCDVPHAFCPGNESVCTRRQKYILVLQHKSKSD